MMRVDGVETVDVDFATKIATVTFDPAVTTADTIAAASTDVGYPATRSGA
ncbi:mercuric transport protein, periplasmic component [Hyphomonas johnsonii MHS-2]|uniref:Mercuric transport protein, periplasmic component n=2 Tax=Hyphomonas johnsonii TaxID=81031 RepID=A0A059FST2_9PROT|nr:mercuric transport protein, periplasmic component [Hyphomonas johnsonii MHS-2]